MITTVQTFFRQGATLWCIAVLSLLMGLSACGGGGAAPAPTAVVITSQPTDQSVVVGTAATFTVTAANATSYQWQLSTDGGISFTDIADANSATLNLAAVQLGDNGRQFRVLVSNSAGSITSNAATLTVNAAASAPVFTTQPVSVSITEGQNAQFTVVVSGTPTPMLQWQLSTDSGGNWSNITGETGTVLNVLNAALANNGRQFRAVATNGSGTVSSNAAVLTVNPAPPLANIVFERQYGIQSSPSDLFLIKEDGTGEIALAATTDHETFLAIAPGGRVVYRRITGTQTNFYSVNADATGTLLLVSSVSSADFPIFNGITPSGWVIYRRDTATAGRDIYAVKADGTGIATLANTSGNEDVAAITPSGRIIYNVNADLYSINADGTGRVTLAASSDYEGFQGVTSTGQLILASCNVFGMCSHYSVNENDGAATLLATDTFADEYSLYLGGITTTGQVVFRKSNVPAWQAGYQSDLYGNGTVPLATSADSEIYYGSTASGQVIYQKVTGGTQYDLSIVNADGSNTIALANSTTSNESFGAVAPDGRIIYGRCTIVDALCDLYAVNADGTGTVALANSADYEAFKGITANGRVIYERTVSNTTYLYAVNTDGTGTTPLANSGGHAFFVGITPNDKVLFRRQPGNADLYIVNADGTGSIPLANTGNNEFFHAFFQ